MTQNHLTQSNHTYFQHLRRAWGIALVLIIHGVFPNVWQTKASDMLCDKAIDTDNK